MLNFINTIKALLLGNLEVPTEVEAPEAAPTPGEVPACILIYEQKVTTSEEDIVVYTLQAKADGHLVDAKAQGGKARKKARLDGGAVCGPKSKGEAHANPFFSGYVVAINGDPFATVGDADLPLKGHTFPDGSIFRHGIEGNIDLGTWNKIAVLHCKYPGNQLRVTAVRTRKKKNTEFNGEFRTETYTAGDINITEVRGVVTVLKVEVIPAASPQFIALPVEAISSKGVYRTGQPGRVGARPAANNAAAWAKLGQKGDTFVPAAPTSAAPAAKGQADQAEAQVDQTAKEILSQLMGKEAPADDVDLG